MPTYTYRCDSCGEMDIKQSIHDKPLLVCPECESVGFVKLYNTASIQFKGTGFYSTDNKGK